MAQLQKLETKVPMKSPEKIEAFFRDSFTALPQLVPDLVKTAEVTGARDGHKAGPGSIMHVKYAIPGAPLKSGKLEWEAPSEEEEGKSLKLTVLEGDILEMYKSHSIKIEMDRDGDQVGWTIEYELANSNVPPPHAYLEVSKQITPLFDNYC